MLCLCKSYNVGASIALGLIAMLVPFRAACLMLKRTVVKFDY